MAQTMMRRGFAAEAVFVHGKTITFKIGCNGNDVFLVPEDRIRTSSEFVEAAMKGPWKESQDRSISLPGIGKQAFSMYFHWLLTGVVHSKGRPSDYPEFHHIMPLLQEILLLPRLFELGHYLLDTDFRDALSDALMQCTSDLQRDLCSFPLDYGSFFYERIPDGSPTRNLVADLVVWTMNEHFLLYTGAKRDAIHPDYTMDLVMAMAARHISKTPGKSPLDGWETNCKYHCHGSEKPCYRSKAEMFSNLTNKRSAAEDVELPNAKRRA
ncbi:hypothetical protein G6011_04316 [Alternaria panax]|uniref:BTB domain-containing protein n=1 Tax=Alternaria panax TaxID=48097 RepID=A0AAD4IH30_9PLEO|nr:hypothetical protein G6011_04316 [Alternaria panax]